jgi:TetR/AcrR family transcriptional repressor of nem operon
MARPREFDERTVVNAAMEVFWEQGYRATSVQDLVTATGLQPGSLYGAFGDKHGLLLEALDAYGQLMGERLDGLLAESADPIDGLRRFIEVAGRDCQDLAMSSRGCLMGNTCTELASHDETARARVEGFMTKFRLAMADALRQGQVMGTFDNDRDPDAVAMSIQASLQGLTLLAKTRHDPSIIDAVIHELVSVLDPKHTNDPSTESGPRTYQRQQDQQE